MSVCQDHHKPHSLHVTIHDAQDANIHNLSFHVKNESENRLQTLLYVSDRLNMCLSQLYLSRQRQTKAKKCHLENLKDLLFHMSPPHVT